MIRRTQRNGATAPGHGRGVLVLQAEPQTSRALALCEAGCGVRVLGVAVRSGACDAGVALELARETGAERWPAVVVTPQARPRRLEALDPPRVDGDPAPASLPRLGVHLRDELRSHWTATCAEAELVLLGIYPRLGSAIGAWVAEESRAPRRVVQLEPDGIAVAEFLGARCHRLSVFDEDPRTQRFARWFGDGWPEVWLCGGWPGLRGFGYELARSGRTWARLPELDCDGLVLPEVFASMVGAGMHALGIADPAAVPWSPPLSPC